jgi:hypothetical protein
MLFHAQVQKLSGIFPSAKTSNTCPSSKTGQMGSSSESMGGIPVEELVSVQLFQDGNSHIIKRHF